jgi:hypothetical protein
VLFCRIWIIKYTVALGSFRCFSWHLFIQILWIWSFDINTMPLSSAVLPITGINASLNADCYVLNLSVIVGRHKFRWWSSRSMVWSSLHFMNLNVTGLAQSCQAQGVIWLFFKLWLKIEVKSSKFWFLKFYRVMRLAIMVIIRASFWPSKQGMCHTVALPFTLKSILRQKKNYEHSNIWPCKNIILKTSSKRNQNLSKYYNSITNLKFQHKPKYHLSKFLIWK